MSFLRHALAPICEVYVSLRLRLYSSQIRINSRQGESKADTHSSREKADFFFVCFF